MVRNFLTLLIFITATAFAAGEGPQTFTLDGRLYDSTSQTNPLLDSTIPTTIQILDSTKNCVLYEESQSLATNLSDGYFTIQIGSPTSGAGSAKRTGNDSGNSMATIMQNNSAVTGKSVVNGSACSQSVSAGAVRYLRISMTPSSTGITTAFTPDIALDSVPVAMVAESLQGLSRTDVLAVDSSGQLSQANLSSVFSNTNYPKLTALLGGTSTQYMSSSSTAAGALPNYTTATPPSAPAAGSIWYDSTAGAVKYYNGSSTVTLGASGAGLSSLTVSSNLTADGTAGGTLSAPGTIDLKDSGVSAGTYTKVTVNAKGVVTSATNITGADITSGTIGGSTAINSSGNITTTGTVTGATLSGTNVTARNVQFFDADTNKITIQAPALAADYSLTLPPADGTSGQYLSTNGSGVLSWASAGSGDFMASGSVPMTGALQMGGNTLYGSSAASGDLTVESTSHATKGDISIAPNGGKVVIGAATPRWDTLLMDIVMPANTSADLTMLVRRTENTFSGAMIGFGTAGTVDATNVNWLVGIPRFSNDFLIKSDDGAAGATRLAITPTGNVGIGTTTPGSALDVNGTLRLSGSTSGYVGFAPAATAGSTTYTLPSADGSSGQVLSTNGSGTLSWATASGGGSSSVTAPAGTSGAPSISFSGDTNTGLYSSAADTIGITAGGADIFAISSAGVVASTTGGGLMTSANGTASAPTFSFSGDTDTGWFRPAADTLAASTGGSERVRISSAGNVGIGTTSPSSALFIQRDTDGGQTNLSIQNQSGAANSSSTLTLGQSVTANPWQTVGLAYYNSWQPGHGFFNAPNGGALATGAGATNGLAIGTYASAPIKFGTDQTERLRIDSTGNVGIGTTTPASALDVTGTISLGGLAALRYPSSDTTAGRSIAIGSSALASQPASAAYNNIAIGREALSAAGMTTSARNNTAIGGAALKSITSGENNVAIGGDAWGFPLESATTGSSNVAIGSGAGSNLTTAVGNVMIGSLAGQYTTTGGENTYIGNGAGVYSSVGRWNTTLGNGAGNTVDGDGNTILGAYAGDSITTGNVNTLIGYFAGRAITSGSSNVLLGPSVGQGTLTTGSNNILIGTSNAVTTPASNTNNFLNIGNAIFGTSLTGSLASPAGNIGIGTISPGSALDVKGTLRLSGSTSGYVGLAPAATAGSTTYTLPSADGSSGQALVTDGSGTLSWASAASGSATSVSATNGSAAAPSIAFSNDTDTGLYSSGTNTFGVTAGGTNIFNISSLGVESTTAGGGLMSQANGTAAAPTFSFSGDTDTGWFRPAANTIAAATGGSERVRIDSSGYVGIGSSSPTELLTIGEGGSNSIPRQAIRIGNQGFGYPSGDGASSSGDKLVIWNEPALKKAIGAAAYELWLQVSGTSQAHISFYTGPTGGVAPSERVRIDSSGNVGIGTTAPAEKLEVTGNIRASGQISSGSATITGGGSATINWNSGNAISTDYNCGSNLIMNNLRDGGTFTLVVTDTGTTQCTFDTSTTGTDAATVSYRFNPANAARTASSHTVYTLMRVGSVVYVSWSSGF